MPRFHPPSRMLRFWPIALGVVWVPALFALTLGVQPVGTREGIEPFEWCLICGSRGTADAVLNVWLFVPLGLLAMGRLGIVRTAVLAAAISTGIELAQLGIPGRYSTFADIVWNGSGAILGAHMYRWLGFVARGGSMPAIVGIGLASCVGVGTFVGGWLLEPSPTQDEYWGQWTPDLGKDTRYMGRVLDARFNEHHFPSARLPGEWSGPEMLRSDWTLTGIVVKGPPPSSFTSVLNIYDGSRRENLHLGAFREHLLLRERMRAQDARLDQPEFMARALLAGVHVGDTMYITARRQGSTRCLAVNDEEVCGPGFTPGRLWGLLAYPSHASASVQRRADVVWLVSLFLPVGLFARSWRWALLNATVATALMVMAVFATALVLGPLTDLVAAFVAALGGRSIGWMLSRTRPEATPER